jgi:hypothetical protein
MEQNWGNYIVDPMKGTRERSASEKKTWTVGDN